MNGFVDIVTLFASPEDRTIEKLSSIYRDKDRLTNEIKQLIDRHIPNEAFKGKKILLKPNWVKHSGNEQDEICMRTHDQFLLAALEVILEKKPASVVIGDTPIQGCNWEKMISNELVDSVIEFSNQYQIPIKIKDFRRATFDPSKNNPSRERSPISEYLIFDLGTASFLEPISRTDRKLFRVTNYSPDRLAEAHREGVHKYCITKELFDSDVVISLPKVKTHQKAGISVALKNLVGLNGDKDYLPHHRLGGTGFGGDCYPGKNYLRYFSELALDQANQKQGKTCYRYWTRLSTVLWRISFPGKYHQLAGDWFGNDTTWRMVLDLNKIALYGNKDGTLSQIPQRIVYSLCDGIIGGQGDGPLQPQPLPLGIISLTNHSPVNDICMGTLMGFEINKVSLLAAAFNYSKSDMVELLLNGETIVIKDLEDLTLKAVLPVGWIDYLKNKHCE